MNNIIKHISKVFVLLILVLFLYNPVLVAQKHIYFSPSDSLDAELFAPNGYISIEVNINDSVQFLGNHLDFTDSISNFEANLDSAYNLLNNNQDFIFTYYNVLYNCISDQISFEVDTNLSDNDNLFLKYFKFEFYNVYTDTLYTCSNATSQRIVTDMPQGEYLILSFDGLVIDSSGNFNPSENVSGIYEVLITSEHCFEPLGDTSIYISILDTTFLDVPDTLFYCSGSDNSDMEIWDYEIIGINATKTGQPILSEITSGYYEVIADQSSTNYCGEGVMTWVEVIPSMDKPIISSEEFCDRVVLRIEDNKGLESIKWSDGSSANTIEVMQNESVSIHVFDKYGCSSKDSLFVEFTPFRVDNLDYRVTDADCWTEGKIHLDKVDVNKAVADDQRRLVNTLNGTYVSDLEDVSEGVYRLEVTDLKNCKDQFDEDIVVHQKCIEDYPVFSPNQDGLEDEYFIPHEGSIKIFDRNGTLLNEFNTPAYWDGTDLSGNQLPMGNYVIITDDNKPVNITLIK